MKRLKLIVLVLPLFLCAGCFNEAEKIGSSSKTESIMVQDEHSIKEDSPSSQEGINLPYPPQDWIADYSVPKSIQEKYEGLNSDQFLWYGAVPVSVDTIACLVKYSTVQDSQSWTNCDVYYITGDTVKFVYTIIPEGLSGSLFFTIDQIYWADVFRNLHRYTISSGETYHYSKPIPSSYFYYIDGAKLYYHENGIDKVYDLEAK